MLVHRPLPDLCDLFGLSLADAAEPFKKFKNALLRISNIFFIRGRLKLDGMSKLECKPCFI
jgi:hypothetical protein